MSPTEFIGGIMNLGQERRGVYLGMHYIDTARVEFRANRVPVHPEPGEACTLNRAGLQRAR
jgi:translation elongation factor EF-4